MNDIILLKQGEIVLKGQNRKSFETKLLSNIKKQVAPYGGFNIYAMQSAIYAVPDASADTDRAFDACKCVFGIASLTRALACNKDIASIFDAVINYLTPDLNAVKSFKVETKRADKQFPMTSIDCSREVGGMIADHFPHLTPDMHNPDLVVNVEIRDTAAYVHSQQERGAGGLPVGVTGRTVMLLSGGIDSPVAAYLAAKRGVNIIPIHFHSPPYTSELAKEKVISLAKILTKFCGKMTVELVPFTAVQEEIRKKCPEEYFTIIMRRLMMRIAQQVADLNGAKGIVTGENLGQVASQTLEALGVTESVCSIPVLRPVLALDKREIIDIARQIGTYDTSVLPYEDCCTLFTPRHPRTRPKPENVIEAENSLDIDTLVSDAIRDITRVTVSPSDL